MPKTVVLLALFPMMEVYVVLSLVLQGVEVMQAVRSVVVVVVL